MTDRHPWTASETQSLDGRRLRPETSGDSVTSDNQSVRQMFSLDRCYSTAMIAVLTGTVSVLAILFITSRQSGPQPVEPARFITVASIRDSIPFGGLDRKIKTEK